MKFKQFFNEEQKYSSAGTSINVSKLPATFGKLDKLGVVKKGMVIADLGGGRYDNAIEWAKEKGAELFVIDRFNRPEQYNTKNIKTIKAKGGADIVTINNVLNVIMEEDIRKEVLEEAKGYLKGGGTVYILIYEGNGSGKGKETQKGKSWQNNKKTREYLDEVKEVFTDASVKFGMIVAKK